jgi:sec-independent protein translocase protein TatA
MGGLSAFHWIVVLAIVLLLFGSRLPNVMGDLAKGIKNFKAGLKDQDEAPTPAAGAEARPLTNAAPAATVGEVRKDEAPRG